MKLENKTIKFIILIIVTLSYQGCTSNIPQTKINNAYYGEMPYNYNEQIKNRIGNKLIDPYSAYYNIRYPKKGHTKKSLIFNTKESFGWVVCGTVNSKNRLGGYVGDIPFFTLFKNGEIETLIMGKVNSTIINSSIENACNR